MAKQITLSKLGGKAPFADGGLKLSKSIPIDKIEPHEDFKSLFKIGDELLERITNSIKENSFDASQPLHIWAKAEDDGLVHNYLIDGYTRLEAAKNAGLHTVPCFEHKFGTFDEAYKYALSLQATANIAQGVTQAITQGGVAGLITGALVGAAGAVQIASIIASKPVPPSFAGGGIVPGSSYSGDRVRANVNSGEMILNAAQQHSLWEMANGRGAGGGANVVVNNSASNVVRAQPQITKDQIEILIDARVNESLRNGKYDQSLAMANQGMDGDTWGT